jgi:hypothetical protein
MSVRVSVSIERRSSQRREKRYGNACAEPPFADAARPHHAQESPMSALRPMLPHPVSPRLARHALLAAALCALPAQATVYKCTGDAPGTVIYQEAPCPKGTELRNFDLDPPELSVVPAFTGPLSGRPAAPADKPAKDTRTLQGDVQIGKATGDASARKFVRQGMTEAEVLARLGRPDATSGGSRGQQNRWSYLPADGDPDTVTTVTFAGGVVSDVTRKVVKK